MYWVARSSASTASLSRAAICPKAGLLMPTSLCAVTRMPATLSPHVSIVAATPALHFVATGTYNRGSNIFTASSIDVVN